MSASDKSGIILSTNNVFFLKFLFILRGTYNRLNVAAKTLKRYKHTERVKMWRDRIKKKATSNQEPNTDVHVGLQLYGKNNTLAPRPLVALLRNHKTV